MTERKRETTPAARASSGSVRRRTGAGGKRRDHLEEALADIERSGGDGDLAVTSDITLHLTNLDKLYFPQVKKTKGDVMRYYVRVAPVLLPLIADRPLILKRYPDGIDGASFYQHDAPADPPAGVRVEQVQAADGHEVSRFVGGTLATLLHCVQLGSIAVNPWSSRVATQDEPDYVVFDLDPGDDAPFGRVVEVALLVRDALGARGMSGAVKTSGASGIHVYVALRAGTPSEAALGWAKDLAEEVAAAAPQIATAERGIKARSSKAVYVDYLQNVTGKSVAAPFSVRARPLATISMPLAWHELEGGGADLDPAAFTLDASAEELNARGRVWRAAMRRKYRIA